MVCNGSELFHMLYSKLKLIHCQNLVQPGGEGMDQNDQGKALIEAHFQFKMLRYADNRIPSLNEISTVLQNKTRNGFQY